MAISSLDYSRVTSLQKKWGMSQEDMYYAIETGMLRVCVWLPLRYIERFAEQGEKLVYEKHELQEGFVRLRLPDCHRIFSNNGKAKVKIFESIARQNNILRLAHELPQPAVSVCINDMVVLQGDIANFEGRTQTTGNTNEQFIVSNNYRYLKRNGQEFHLGDIQASIIKQLHDAADHQNPWLHGKTLLSIAGSNATRLRDVFKNRVMLSSLIESSGRGYYRLKADI